MQITQCIGLSLTSFCISLLSPCLPTTLSVALCIAQWRIPPTPLLQKFHLKNYCLWNRIGLAIVCESNFIFYFQQHVPLVLRIGVTHFTPLWLSFYFFHLNCTVINISERILKYEIYIMLWKYSLVIILDYYKSQISRVTDHLASSGESDMWQFQLIDQSCQISEVNVLLVFNSNCRLFIIALSQSFA